MERLTNSEPLGVKENVTIRDITQRLSEYEDTGYTPTDIKSLVGEWKVNLKCLDSYRKAESEGRLLKLRCKIGDTVYILWDGFNSNRDSVYPAVVSSVSLIRMYGDVSVGYSVEPSPGIVMAYLDADFGKRWFLTHEDAEAALECMRAG